MPETPPATRGLRPIERRYRRLQLAVALVVVLMMVVVLALAEGWFGGACGLLVGILAVRLGFWIDRRSVVREAMTRG